MIGTAVFVIIFVALGLGVVLVAMRSGHRPATTTPPGRGSRRATNAGIFALIVAIGLAVPAAVLVANAANQDKKVVGGSKLTSAQAEGRQMFDNKCATCHTLAASRSVGRVGPNLDQLNGGDLKQAFVLDAIVKGRNRGAGNMPAALVDGEQAEDVASYVAAVSGR